VLSEFSVMEENWPSSSSSFSVSKKVVVSGGERRA
jgi:hypothetical protein